MAPNIRRWAVSVMAGSVLAAGLGFERNGRAADADTETARILVEAVEAAAALDFYHARCRGDVSARRTENLNKLLASRQRTTVLRVQDELFPERHYRRAQERLEAAALDQLAAAGGCPAARQSALPEQLRLRYEAAMEAVRRLP